MDQISNIPNMEKMRFDLRSISGVTKNTSYKLKGYPNFIYLLKKYKGDKEDNINTLFYNYYCRICPDFDTTDRIDLEYHLIRQHRMKIPIIPTIIPIRSHTDV